MARSPVSRKKSIGLSDLDKLKRVPAPTKRIMGPHVACDPSFSRSPAAHSRYLSHFAAMIREAQMGPSSIGRCRSASSTGPKAGGRHEAGKCEVRRVSSSGETAKPRANRAVSEARMVRSVDDWRVAERQPARGNRADRAISLGDESAMYFLDYYSPQLTTTCSLSSAMLECRNRTIHSRLLHNPTNLCSCS